MGGDSESICGTHISKETMHSVKTNRRVRCCVFVSISSPHDNAFLALHQLANQPNRAAD